MTYMRRVCPKGDGQSSCGFIIPADGMAVCWRCGRRLPVGPPVDIGAAHLLADIKGYGLRSGRRP